MKKIRLVLAGLGAMSDTWIRAAKQMEQVELVGFVEINSLLVESKVKQHKLNPRYIFRTLSDALEMLRVDGVVLVTPPDTHKELSFIALEAGVPVLSEKPIADTFSSAQAIVAKSEESGVPHMVAQDYRYKPEIQTIKRLLDSGKFGQISSVVVNFFKGIKLTGFHQQLEHPLLIDMAIHHFDLMRFLLDLEPIRVTAKSWNPPYSSFKNDASAVVNIEFENSIVANYTGSWTSSGAETTWNGDWRFECEKGVVLLVDDIIYTQRRKKRDEIISDNISLARHQKRKQETVIDFERERQQYLLSELRKVISEGITPGTSCQDNLKSLGMVFGAIDSIKNGTTVVIQ